MSCINPLKMKDRNGNITEVPCRHCIGCTIKKIQDLRFLAESERVAQAEKGFGSAFIRLSYNDAFLPVIYKGQLKRLGELVENGKIPLNCQPTLLKVDFVNFMKRLRKDLKENYGDRKVKVIYCGEYGEKNTCRSHYHMILFGLNFKEAQPFVNANWHYGFCDFKPFKSGAVRYIASYMFHDVFGKEREKKYTSKGIEPPFLFHSVELGKDYYMKYSNKSMVTLNGTQRPFPTYIKNKYGLEKKFFDDKQLEEFKKQSIAKAQEYIIKQRQSGVPVDDVSVITQRCDINNVKNIIKRLENEN